MKRSRLIVIAVTILVAGLVTQPRASCEDTSATVEFSRDVLPILIRNCFRCHEGRDSKSEIRLDQRPVLLGSNGESALVVPGNSRRSRLWIAVSGAVADLSMPPEGPRLKPEEMAVLKTWIDTGMSWDEQRLPDESGAGHWAFQRINHPVVPTHEDDLSSENPVDRFIANKRREQNLHRAGMADRHKLIRRLYLSMHGLPPTFEQTRRFTDDDRPEAWPRLVDQVLASPRYGERWGRHWLDVARWAESEGYESNHPRASAWRYRDYVVRSFNQDRPFDEFIRQQVAGDEIPEYSDDNLIATGFLAAARISSNEEDK